MEGLTVEKTYFDKVHRWGKISSLTSLAVMLCVPLAICIYYDVWPQANIVMNGLLKVIPLFWTVAVIEVITYAPMLGAGGTYLSFVTGNISNLKLPCGLNAMQSAGVRANTEEGEVVSTIAIAASAITTTVVIALGVLLFSPILPKITAEGSPFAPAFQQVLPALFGALGAGYFAKHWRISVLPIAFGTAVLVFAPGMLVGTLIFVTVAVSLAGTHIMYKRKII
jgi:hypothetical protein